MTKSKYNWDDPRVPENAVKAGTVFFDKNDIAIEINRDFIINSSRQAVDIEPRPAPEWQPKIGDPVFYWDADFNQRQSAGQLEKILPEDYEHRFFVRGNYWSHIALVRDLSEIGMTVEQIKARPGRKDWK